MVEVPTTPRRSKRFQPTVFAHTSSLVSRSSSTDTWTDQSKPLHSRPTTADDLFEPDEIDLGTAREDEEDIKKGREEREVEYETRFYQSFTRRVKPLKAKSSGKGKQKAAGDEKIEFKVGDTVLVVTDLRKTSVAVVTAMWEVIGGEPNESDGEDEDGERGKKMRVRVHWFVKPTQLPSVRVKRDHFEVRSPGLVVYCPVCGAHAMRNISFRHEVRMWTLWSARQSSYAKRYRYRSRRRLLFLARKPGGGWWA